MNYYIDCPKCSVEWRLSGTLLIQVASEQPANRAAAARHAASAALMALAQEIVAKHFAGHKAANKKAELAALEAEGLTRMSYRSYLDHCKRGGTLVSAAYPLGNMPWLRAAAKAQGVEARLNQLEAASDSADEYWREASKLIIRMKLPGQ